MKIKVDWAKTVGRPEYSSDRASCAVEYEVPDDLLNNPVKLREQRHKLQVFCYEAVEEQLAAHAPPPREPGDDVDDDVRPGDPAYERNRPPARADDRGSFDEFGDGSAPRTDRFDERYDDGPQRGRGDRRDARPVERPRNDDRRGPPPRRDERPRQQGGGGQRTYGPPRSARAFCGWFQSLNDTPDGAEIRKEVYRLLKAWDLPTTVKDLTNDDAVAVYDEIMGAKRNGRSGGGWGGNDRNGDGRGR